MSAIFGLGMFGYSIVGRIIGAGLVYYFIKDL